MGISPDDPEGPRLTFVQHLEELRGRLGVCLLAVAVGSVASWCVAERLLEWLKRPAGWYLPMLAVFTPTEALMAYMKLALGGGVVLAMPVMLYQLWHFVQAGLTWRERALGLAFVWWGSVLFALGAAFAYWVCLPAFLKFLLTIGAPALQPVISVDRYLSFVLGTILSCGVLFELPLVIVLLAKLGILMPESLQRHRGMALLILTTVAAVVTPTTDAVSLAMMTVPLAVLYEIAILVAKFTVSR